MDNRVLKFILILYFVLDNFLFLAPGLVTVVLLATLVMYSGYGLIANGFFRSTSFTKGEVYLLLFMIAAVFSSLWNNDFNLLLDILLLAVPFFALKNKFRIDLRFINTLFLLQIFISILTTIFGYNEYGFIPSQVEGTQFWWRISLYAVKTPPYSGFIASLVLLVNLHFNKTKWRWIILMLAIYFTALSGSRSIYIFWILYLGWKFIPIAKGLLANKFLPYITLTIVLFAQKFFDLLLLAFGSYNFFNFFARTESFTGRKMDMSRLYLYEYFFDVFLSWPFFGVGDALAYSRMDGLDIGSETWFIVLFAAMGFGAILINFYFINSLKIKLRNNNLFQYWALVLFVIVFMFYSSYIKPFNYGTILCISFMLSSNLNRDS